jgi:sugar (pentulose or hexulose) kinase
MEHVCLLILSLLFKPSLHKIATHIEYLLGLAECSSVHHLFLVGGFAESSLLRNAIKNKVGSKVKVITPPRPGCSVVTGAVFYGIDPQVIVNRIAMCTIGVDTASVWIEEKHKGKQWAMDDMETKYCLEVFNSFVTVGEPITIRS